MRQGQQNRRGRSRGNNNNQQRKGQNPLTRSFESNGPDVKLRGTPAHIAEKYMSLARDAHSSGDPVLAENYLQHAEHYNRIIMAYREQQVSQGGDPGPGGGFNGQSNRGEGGFGSDLEGAEEGDEFSGEAQMMPRLGGAEQPRVPEGGGARRFEDRPQRTHGDQPRHQHHGQRDRGFQEGRGGFGDRRDRPERHDRGDRPERFDRPDRDRSEMRDRSDRPDRDRQDRGERFDRGQPPGGGEIRGEGGPPRRRDRGPGDRGTGDRGPADRMPQEAHEQPEFLRRPVRRPRREDQEEGAEGAGPAPVAAGGDDTGRE